MVDHSVPGITTLLTLLIPTVIGAFVLLGTGVWVLKHELGDVTRALGFAALIIGILLLAVLVPLLILLVQTGTEVIGSP